jgi:hypothetical protein
VRTYDVPPGTRVKVLVNGIPEIPDGEQFGTLIESTAPITVEQSVYSNASGIFWAAGTSVTAVRIP